MNTYRLQFLIKSEKLNVVTFCVTTDASDDVIASYVCCACDALRALLPEHVRILFGVAWRVDGTLSVASDVRVFHLPVVPQIDAGEIGGARESAEAHDFLCLRMEQNTGEPYSQTYAIPAAIHKCDLTHIIPNNVLSLYTPSPLLNLCVPFTQAAMKQLDGLGANRVQDDGTLQPVSVTDTVLRPAVGFHMLQKQREWARTRDAGKVMQARLCNALRLAERACLDLQARMERFTQQWGDNHTVEESGAQYICDSISAGAVAYDLAASIGLDLETALPGFGFQSHRVFVSGGIVDDNGNTIGGYDTIRESFTTIPPEDFTVRERNPDTLTVAIRDTVSAVSFLRDTQASLELVRTIAGHHGRKTSDYILNLKSVWFGRYTNLETGQTFSQFFEGPTHPDNGFTWFLISSQCERQQASLSEWQGRGGNEYASAYYAAFDEIAQAMHTIKKGLAIILLSMRLAPIPARAWWRRWNGTDNEPVGNDPYVSASPVDNDWLLVGNACNWIETRAPKRGPFRTLVHPCSFAETALRIKPRAGTSAPPLWDNTIHDPAPSVFDYAAAFILGDHQFRLSRYRQDRTEWQE